MAVTLTVPMNDSCAMVHVKQLVGSRGQCILDCTECAWGGFVYAQPRVLQVGYLVTSQNGNKAVCTILYGDRGTVPEPQCLWV